MGMGFAGLALDVMLNREGFGSESGWSPPNGLPHFAPKAKSVIWLFMNGGVQPRRKLRSEADAHEVRRQDDLRDAVR